jgi:hypothetical protein
MRCAEGLGRVIFDLQERAMTHLAETSAFPCLVGAAISSIGGFCPPWVISGHIVTAHAMSALPP